jgi:hypothetical protein
MRIVVAGGSGFIGRHLSLALVADGHLVTVLTRARSVERATPGGLLRYVHWNPSQPDGTMADVLSGADAVVNLAGANLGSRRWTRRRKGVRWVEDCVLRATDESAWRSSARPSFALGLRYQALRVILLLRGGVAQRRCAFCWGGPTMTGSGTGSSAPAATVATEDPVPGTTIRFFLSSTFADFQTGATSCKSACFRSSERCAPRVASTCSR